ncbi:hypothetical protein HW555_004651 [Spodoptera exigua]|uniref:PHD-type domain-containing protein n=1 Tax=Spodoptera exigua TaxID=7107 RepID=A0A835GJY2_SPOEX|nr:hypothetical protein HW555_004651 [Spodoptera exigua]
MSPIGTTIIGNSSRKITSLVICHKCKKKVDIKSTALCSACDNRYELDCDGYPEHTYRLKDSEEKQKWRCKTCIRGKKYGKTDSTSGITLRKKPTVLKTTPPTQQVPNIQSNSTMLTDSHILTECETSDESYITPNKLSRSVDRTVSDMITTSEMKETIDQLTLKLESTENELENELLENTDLKKHINKLSTEINTLKSLCKSTHIFKNPGSSTKKKKQTTLQQQQQQPSSPFSSTLQDEISEYVRRLEQEIVKLQKKLQIAEQEIALLTERISHGVGVELHNCETDAQASYFASKNAAGAKNKNKLYIISSNCTRGTLPLIEEVFYNQFEYCNYIVPNVTSKDFLRTIRYKLKDFSMNDYCLIFIGEKDIQNGNHADILHNLNYSMKNITHTNIVICTPIYVKGALIHNYKVEFFNNLLLTDIKNNEYAYFFDCNATYRMKCFPTIPGK